MSSPATLLSVVCYGIQDTRLLPPKGQPDIKHYVKVLKKTTRWAAQWIRVDFDGQPNFGQLATCTIPRKAEILTQVTLVVTMPDIATVQTNARNACAPGGFLGPTYGWTNSLGHALINQVEFSIGGVTIDRMDGLFLEARDELYESLDKIPSKNRMINRVANGFNGASLGQDPANPTVNYVPLPFWFSQGDYAQGLPVDALSTEQIQIGVTFRPINQLYYTNSRMDSRNPGFRPTIDINGAMPSLLGGYFFKKTQNGNRIYSTDPMQQNVGISGEILQGYTIPNKLNMGDAYLLCEYISLEEAEAVALRSSQLDYRIEQHYIVPTQNTQRGPKIRLPLPYNNPVKELIWFLQRQEVANYNSWFLTARDLNAPTTDPSSWWSIPWWPDAVITTTDQAKPAFRNAYSEPMRGAQLTYSNLIRFNHNSSPSLFRSVLPVLHYRKAPLFNRYIYVYPFGLAPGATDDTSMGPSYNPRGTSNFDKLPKIELQITMNPDSNEVQHDMSVHSYLTTYNIFRVFGGRGVLLFSY